ncbi:MAG TPA: histidinol-phosphate transaminase [Steroidobacteraceae bacterium]|nr:histidinol-phosphate transaminase [Steroidobacteraceae bacterium]
MSWVTQLARPAIVALEAYAPAAWEPELTRLHANELPWRVPGDESHAGLNRYPEPQPRALVERLAGLYGVARDSVLVSRGSDEAIDLLIRTFCRAELDAVLVCPPTFGMYAVAAQIQGAAVRSVPLRAAEGFTLDEAAVLGACTAQVKIVFLCSPNNPTGNLLEPQALLRVARALAGRALVVVDEAYIEFARHESLAQQIAAHPNLCVLRTLSKAHGLAGARCGTLIADPEIVGLLRKVIAPYAITQLTLEAALRLLQPAELEAMRARVTQIRAERELVAHALARLPRVVRVWSSAANFLLAQFRDSAEALARARAARLLVRDLRTYPELPGALRVTIGTASQNARLMRAWA